MIGTSKVVAVIPARGGSKGIPKKNIVNICGKPLISYTIKSATRSRYIDRVIVSTDDSNIAKVAEACGAEVPFMRPGRLSGDTTHTPPVIVHAVKFIESQGYDADIVITLQPTSPLRQARQIDEAIEKLYNSSIDAVVSVKQAEYPPYWMLKMKRSRAIPFINNGRNYFKKERQQLPKTYQLNGAIYATRKAALFKEKAVISKKCGVIVMDRRTSMDIDTPEDLERVRTAVNSTGRKG